MKRVWYDVAKEERERKKKPKLQSKPVLFDQSPSAPVNPNASATVSDDTSAGPSDDTSRVFHLH